MRRDSFRSDRARLSSRRALAPRFVRTDYPHACERAGRVSREGRAWGGPGVLQTTLDGSSQAQRRRDARIRMNSSLSAPACSRASNNNSLAGRSAAAHLSISPQPAEAVKSLIKLLKRKSTGYTGATIRDASRSDVKKSLRVQCKGLKPHRRINRETNPTKPAQIAGEPAIP